MAIKLVSFSVCPFVQRAVAMLRYKNVEFDVEYIDLANKPEWFLKLSPRGKVPIVVLDDDRVLFESQAICEFLEDQYPEPALFPTDPVDKARDRAWFGTAPEDLFGPLWLLETAQDQAAVDAAKEKLMVSLARLESALEGRDWLSGDGSRFGMADVGACSAATRMRALQGKGFDVLADFPKVAAWTGRILKQPAVQHSVPAVWEADHDAYMQKNNAVLLNNAA